jgi:glycosyltransferase involved in cell wall biosynthesis
MASGLYPIVTDIPANREVVDDGTNGSFIPLDDIQALTDRIVEIVRYPQRLPEVIRHNFSLIQSRYEEKQVMLEVERLYQQLVQSHKR